MPARIRLQRRGTTNNPFYHIVIADGRAPRDGRFIEKIGTYNPLTKPALIDIDTDKALLWLQKGAMPTDTVRSILSHKGIMLKSHLLKGVKKGALTLEQAEVKFQAWIKDKQDQFENKKKELQSKTRDEFKKRLEQEAKLNEAKAEAIAKKKAKALEKEAEVEQAPVVAEEEVKTESPETAPTATTEEQPQAGEQA